ncbi:MAG: nuclear transport factor 2 family protein [Paracoccaceae bacterium]|nr:nuclear transport factor 2 family protein [Paracoccaceae bacterium]
MPIVELHVLEGYDAEAKQRLGNALTDAVRFVVPAAPELVTILIHDIARENYHRGRTPRTPAPAKADPSETVRSFLSAMEARDVEYAQSFLSPDFQMQFPGTGPMSALQELMSWASARYRFVTKTYEGFDAMQSAGDAAIVYCRGTLSGEWPDGTKFTGIRFIDRFEVVGSMLTKQDVWNDIAETKAGL